MADPFLAHDASFQAVTGRRPRLDLVVETDAHEGPVYQPAEDALFVTTTRRPVTSIRRIPLDGRRFPVDGAAVTSVDVGAVMPNGMFDDGTGGLLVCEQGDLDHHAAISRIDPGAGHRTVLVDAWRGRRLNSPNDVTRGPDGAVWFTDPDYGHRQGFRPAPELGPFVHRWDPATGRVDVVADGFVAPNGIALAPDGSTLYVTDSGADRADGRFHVDLPHHVVAFDVTAGGRLTGRRLLAVTAPGIPDGLTVDADGRVYVSSDSGVVVLSPEGHLLGEILVPGTVNFTFGGPDGDVLFITADTAVWAAALATTGVRSSVPASTGSLARGLARLTASIGSLARGLARLTPMQGALP